MSVLHRLTFAALIGLVGAGLVLQGLIFQSLVPPAGLLLAIGSAISAAVVASRRRWSPAVGAVWCALMVSLNAPFIVHDLSNPADVVNFVFNLWTVPLLMLGIVAGIAATIWGVGRPAPTWLGSALVTGAGVLLGGSVVAIMPRPSGAELSPALMANSTRLTAQHMTFDQTEVHVRAGQPAVVQLTNADGIEHSFDIDALGVHTYLPSGKTQVTVFQPSTPGTYTFYCGIPGHADRMQGTLIVDA